MVGGQEQPGRQAGSETGETGGQPVRGGGEPRTREVSLTVEPTCPPS